RRPRRAQWRRRRAGGCAPAHPRRRRSRAGDGRARPPALRAALQLGQRLAGRPARDPRGAGVTLAGRAASPPQRLDFLDGLRGWAALVVVFSHLWGQFARHLVPVYGTVPLRALSCGHLAVVVFFVLSGTALSLQFVRTSQPVTILPALAARYVRLVVPIA